MSFAAVICMAVSRLASAASPSDSTDMPPLTVDLNAASIAHRYDGHGALSAGASSRLLQDYPPEQRDEILDLLFKPNYGMSLDLLKVEIGGDTQSTDGSEPSYARSPEEIPECNVERGYEAWLLKEAKKRNPEIVVSALAWGVPGWINSGTVAQPRYFNTKNIEYQVGWVKCVKDKLGITTDYLGIWNERVWGTTDYVVELRAALDKAGFNQSVTGIVMLDGVPQPEFFKTLYANSTLANAIEAVGLHYPCNAPMPDVLNKVHKKFWASEDFSTPADWKGAGCWGRVLNSNYVRMNMTSTISWSLLWAVYPNLDCFGNGLMYAFEPWSGHYEVNPTVWTTAHTTQFVKPGWHYLSVGPGGGSGALPTGGGTYVTLREASQSGSAFNWTIVIETLAGDCLYNAGCYSVGTWSTSRQVQFRLTDFLGTEISDSEDSQGALTLQFWSTNSTHQFVRLPDVQVTTGSFTIEIAPDSIYTLSTTSGQTKAGAPASPPPTPPASAGFPLPYSDSFDSYEAGALAKYWSDQAGSFEVRHGKNGSGEGGRLQQVVLQCPIQWINEPDPFTVAGSVNWTDYEVFVDARTDGQVSDLVPVTGCGGGYGSNTNYVAVCGRLAQWAGFAASPIAGYCLRLFADGQWSLVTGWRKGWPSTLASGKVYLPSPGLSQWHKLGLRFVGPKITGFIDGQIVVEVSSTAHPVGMTALSSGWHLASFDNFEVKPVSPAPPVKNGLLSGMRRLTYNYHERSCQPQPRDTDVRNNFGGKVGLAFAVNRDSDVMATALLRFMVDGNCQPHQLELLEVQAQSTVKVADVTLDMANSSALKVDSLGFASAPLSNPVRLSKGKTYYLLSSEVKGGDEFLDQISVDVNANLGVSVIGSVWSEDGDSVYHYGVPGSWSYGPLSLYVEDSVDIQYI